MSRRSAIFVANTNVLDVEILTSAIEDTFINDADMEVTIKDARGVAVDADPENSIWPLAMDYVTASDGWYRAIIPHDLPFVADVQYFAHIEADAGTERVAHWEFPFIPKTRRDR